MKKSLLFLLSLIPFLSFGQQSSWFEVELEFGGWSSNSQSILITQGTDTLYYETYGTFNPARYRYAVINANATNIQIKLTSYYSTYWYSYYYQSPSYVNIRNYTQGDILDLYQMDWNNSNVSWTYSTTDNAYIHTNTLGLSPQPPPVAGCMDSTSSSYNPNANLSNNQCAYPVSFAVDMNSYPDTFSQVYVSGQFNSWSGIADSLSDPDGDNIWTGTIDILNNPGWLWKYSVDNWADQELPTDLLGGGNPYATCFTYDPSGPFANRGLIVDGAPVVLDTNCWEKCLSCEDIIGCTDSTSNEFNPWATVSDGQCQGNVIPTCGPGQTYLQVYFVPDNFPSESSWILYDDNGAVYTASQGTYNGYQPGVGVSHYICVDTNVLVDIVIQDSYGDGLCGTCYGGTVNGNLQVLDCNGNTLFNLADSVSNSNFGYLYTTPQFNTGSACTGGTSSIAGCMDPFSLNYNPNATIGDGSCGTQRVVGCTDNSQFNYNPNANTSEIMTGDYTLKIYDGQANGWGGTWLGIKQGDWLSPQYKIGPNDGYNLTFNVPLNIYQPIELYLFTTSQSQGSIAQVAYTLYGPEGDTIVDVPYWGAQSLQFPVIQTPTALPTFGDVCIPKVFGCTDTSAFNYDPLANTDNGGCIPVIVGCMNPLSFNYDSTANTAGTCIPIVVGCMDSTQYNYDSTANTSGACIPFIYGCTDSSKFNYNSLANTDDNSCIPFIYGCIDPTAYNYDSLANTSNGSCIPTLYGCTDSTAFNYNPLANTNNGSCIPKVYGCTNVNSINYNPAANIDDSTCIPIIYGCTDSTAFNYNPLANTNNNTCIAKVYGCTNPSSLNYNPLANTDDGSCIPYIYGCTDSTMFNYNPLANTNNGTCIPFIYGCTDPNAFNYDPTANTNQVSANDLSSPCIPKVYGCTDSTAVNYDPNANVDNGSCIAAVYGCTDPNAYNYNPNANVSDTTACLYDAGCITGPGNPYWLNDPCYAWVIDVDNYCCTHSWDPDCQSLYDYCATTNGTLDFEEFAFNNIVVFPNPTTGVLTIRSNLDITYSLYDFIGREVIKDSNEDVIDITNLPNGVYFLSIKYGEMVFNKRVVKED